MTTRLLEAGDDEILKKAARFDVALQFAIGSFVLNPPSAPRLAAVPRRTRPGWRKRHSTSGGGVSGVAPLGSREEGAGSWESFIEARTEET